jgi:hypothetical protein
MALDLLGVPYRYVTGYSGEADLRLAIQRGEINYIGSVKERAGAKQVTSARASEK